VDPARCSAAVQYRLGVWLPGLVLLGLDIGSALGAVHLFWIVKLVALSGRGLLRRIVRNGNVVHICKALMLSCV
jgi:hypothetical protein